MNIYKKLNAARAEFHTLSLKKTGLNKFAGYEYFELSDFLIPAMKVLDKHGLCFLISFGKEVATMRIVDTDDGQAIEITSPMSTAALKGCHEVQNLGAVQSYLRRYLWVAALEIVEHDALDATTGKEAPATKQGPDVAAILRGIANSPTVELLKANFEAALTMLEPPHHPAITKTKNARYRVLNQAKETA